MTDSLMATYKRLPVTFSRGEGAWLWDKTGKRYLDALSGIAVCGLGHAHPHISRAICDQSNSLIHTSNLYGIEKQQALADKLTACSGMDRVFFANSGAEANEAAIKIARLFGHQKDLDTPTIIVMDNSFHGRTLATLTATGNRKAQAGFEPLVKGFIRVPFGDSEALRTVARNTSGIVAVMVEPIQGEGGINIPNATYLQDIRALCDEQGWLMILDEIQTGMGRTGKMFAYQHSGAVPDILTLAKALGNGVPVGACLARGSAADTFGPGNHGSTFGGNPLACAAGLAVVEILQQEDLPLRAQQLGLRLLQAFQTRLGAHPGVRDIRGLGLMLGIELDRPCAELVTQALEAGLLINVTAEKVVRLLPPLILDDEQADLLVSSVAVLIENFLA
jgi:acetylornithine/N-succinyldiaminopimelate aminotransferase